MSKFSTEIAKPFEFLNPGSIDKNRGPYLTVADACRAIPNASKRVNGVDRNLREGKIVDIGTEKRNTPYTWKDGFADHNLVEQFDDMASKKYLDSVVNDFASKDDLQLISSGIGMAEFGVPPSENIFTYTVSFAGTYPLFGGLIVNPDELDGNLVQFRRLKTGWAKVKTAIPVVDGPVFSDDLDFDI